MTQSSNTHPRVAAVPASKIAKAAAESEYLDTEDAARFLLLSRKTLERFRVEGTGPRYFKVGAGLRAKVVYRKDDLRAFVEAITYSSTSQYSKRDAP